MTTTINKYYHNIKLNYVFTFFTNFNMTSGIWMIYLASKGLSLVWLGILEGIFHLTSLLMETPTGAIADIKGRKFSRQLGLLISILYFVIMLSGTKHWHYMVAFVFYALSYNLESGAGDALIYDSLKVSNQENKFMKVTGIKEVVFQIASGIGIAVGGYLAVQNYDTPFKLMIGIGIISFIIAAFFKEVEIGKPKEKPRIFKAIKDQYVISFSFIKKEKRVLFLSIVLNLIGTFVLIGFFYMQNYWKGLGVSEFTIGILLGLHGFSAALGGYFAHRVEKKLGEKKIIILVTIFISAAYWLLYFPIASFIVIVIIGFVDSLFYVVLSTYINHLIPSEQRATLLSFSSMIFSMMMIVLFPLVGFLGDTIGLSHAFLIMALIITLITAKIIYQISKK